jgi:hypothetical protein
MRDDALPMARLVLAGMAVVATVAIAVGIVLAILAHRHVPVGGIAIDKPAQLADGLPMLQTAPQPDLAAYQAAKRRALDGGAPHRSIAAAMALRAASAAASGSPR